MFQEILEYIETFSTIIPTEEYSMRQWVEEVNELFEHIDDAESLGIKDALLEIIPSFYKKAKLQATNNACSKKRKLEDLLTAPQIAQRSEEWYIHMKEFLTASQTATLLAGGLTRAKLVMSKVETQEQRSNRLVAWSHETNPFDWGIRFEPVAKMLYEAIYKSSVIDIGRVTHKCPGFKLAASPDGVVTTGHRMGRLVEFKAPISRQIRPEEVPKDYWVQTQIQMEVADIDQNDYFEIEIRSKKKSNVPVIEGPCFYHGIIYMIGVESRPTRYIYGALNSTVPPSRLEEGESVLEIFPWELMNYNQVTVQRSKEWFTSIIPEIKKFWDDVELARNGKFQLPSSKRKSRYSFCLIEDEPPTLSVDIQDEIMIGC